MVSIDQLREREALLQRAFTSRTLSTLQRLLKQLTVPELRILMKAYGKKLPALGGRLIRARLDMIMKEIDGREKP